MGKYKEDHSSSTTFHWYIKRGCALDKTSVTSGTSSSDNIYGVSVTNYVCTYKNGTLCNGKIKAYDTTLEIKTQNVRKLQCFECATSDENPNPLDPCYTI